MADEMPERPSGKYREPYEYEADMLRSSMQEQKRRESAKSNPKLRAYYTQGADEAHAEMQRSAESGMAARRAKKRNGAKRSTSSKR